MDLKEILLSDDVVKSINDNLDYLVKIIPEIRFMFNFDQKNPQHHLDVWNHTLLALSLSEKDFDVRLCLLLHDIGKPFSYQEEKVRHFKNHNKISANISKELLCRLKYDEEYIMKISTMIYLHDLPILDSQIEEDYDFCLKLYEVQRCDALAHNPIYLKRRIEYLDKTKEKLLKRQI